MTILFIAQVVGVSVFVLALMLLAFVVLNGNKFDIALKKLSTDNYIELMTVASMIGLTITAIYYWK